VTTSPQSCAECGYNIPPSSDCCPTCGRPSLFPNVRAASDSREVGALASRYASAAERASERGLLDHLQKLQQAIQQDAIAVITMDIGELERVARSDQALFITYYAAVSGGFRNPGAGFFDALRGPAEEALFQGYKEKINFAALALDGNGLRNYGNTSVTLRTELIAYRASLYESNNVIHTVITQDLRMGDAASMPAGHRATWDGRDKLVVVKHANHLESEAQMKPDVFATVLLHNGATTRDDDFVEVHIYGPMSVYTISKVRIARQGNRRLLARIAELRKLLADRGIPLEVT